MPEASATLCICNTSPIFYLHAISKLSLLADIYGRVVTTTEVIEELRAGGDVGETVPDIAAIPWIDVREIAIPGYISLISDLGRGEASVLALGIEHPTQALLIMDDKLGRRIGKLHSLRITGTAGVLLKAKTSGLIPSIRPMLDGICAAGFRLRDSVRRDILALANEL